MVEKTLADDSYQEGMAKGLAEGEAKGIAKGLAEGEAKGIAKGLAEGEAKGIAKGKAEGELSSRLDIAQNMLASGMSDAQVIQLTGLTKEQVDGLKKC